MDRRVAGGIVLGVAGLGIAGAAALWLSGQERGRAPSAASPAPVAERSALALLGGRLASGDTQALAELRTRLEADLKTRAAVPAKDAADWVVVLDGLRGGFARFNPQGRLEAVAATVTVLDKFAVEPAPAEWAGALVPTHDVLTLALNDAATEVRVTTLTAVARLWDWVPGRDLFTVERDALADFKRSFREPVVACLGNAETPTRAAAVQCLAALPLDDEASAALMCLNDPEASVRLQVLAAFADRRNLLTEEAIFPLLNDPNPGLIGLATKVLNARGLNGEQVGLCKMLGHPKADVRASAIPFLLKRTDLDPVLGLIYLTRDVEESVRLKAVEALEGKLTPEATTRLQEMAAVDPSPAVRAAANKLVPVTESTANLPPLPGSPSLLPKAN